MKSPGYEGGHEAGYEAGPSGPFADHASEPSSLLMRFFESEFFDAWIAVSYLHKDLPEQTREYLCQRIYQLPESDVEPYVSQLCQLYVSKGGDDPVERLLIGLCANSLNIAVKTYWILLAISQDHEVGTRSAREETRNTVNRLKDRCELAGLQGHWEIPFKEARLSPVSIPGRRESRSNRFMRNSIDEPYVGVVGAMESDGAGPHAGNGGSEGEGQRSGGLFGNGGASLSEAHSVSSYLTETSEIDEKQGTKGSFPANKQSVSGGTGDQAVMVKMDVQDAIELNGDQNHPRQRLERVSPRTSSGYLSTVFAVDTGVEGLIYDEGASGLVPTGAGHSPRMDSGLFSPPGGSSPMHADIYMNSVPMPSSPKRRETTFGATLDFVEALCSASSALASVVEEERQWALQKALRNINTEIERASRGGVAIWFPMARAAPQRVIRLAFRESRLLNSREKAPFTLYVEVLNETTSLMEAQGVLIDSKSRPQSAELNLADLEGSLEYLHLKQTEAEAEFDVRAVAEEAAAAGIQWVSQHHRKSSSTDFTANSMDASIALQAVKGSSAAQNAHMPLVSNEALQLTPSIRSQISDVSVLASSPATESREGSPDKREVPGQVQPPPYLYQPQIGGGTWIGKVSKNLGQTSMSSPRIQAALDDIRGEGPVVRVRLHIDASPKAQASNDAKTVIPAKRCANSTVWCSIGFCRCPKPEKSHPVAVASSRVRVELIVRGGLDLSIRKTRHRRTPTQEALMHIAQQHTLPTPPPPMATIESGAEYHGNDPPGVTMAVAAAGERHEDVVDSRTGRRGSDPSGTEVSPSGETPTTVLANNRSVTEEEGDSTSSIDVYGEKWVDRKERIRKRSPHGTRPGWDLAAVIVKDGDDCRQELLSMQLIRTFQSIFQEAGLPLWLRPYDILVTSNLTALIEMIPNAPSIHNVKSSFANQDMTLRGHFLDKYGLNGERTPAFDAAQNNFVESMAGYSLLCYVLQLRDRHNGNILLDDQGHIIHIDFGFMLSNSPGGVNFESAPFKLTRELLEVMDSDSDGTSSKPFDYFKVLMIQGFVAICKHSDRVVELVSMMSESGCPCFRNKQLAVEGLQKRISNRMSEEKCVDHVLDLISEALDNWRTRQYDYYQRILNGIR